MEHAVVIGRSPEALRFAAGLSRLGILVRYLGTAEHAAGVSLELPWGPPAARIPDALLPALESVWGNTLPVAEGALAVGTWTRGAVALERDRKRDRIARRFGLAEQWTKRQPERPWALEALWTDAVLDAGGDVLTEVAVEGFDVQQGAVEAVETEHGREHVMGSLFVDAPMATIVGWAELDVDGAALDALAPAHRVQVALRGELRGLPWLLHTPNGLPFERLWRPGLLLGGARWQGTAVAELSAAEGSPLWTATDAALGARIADAASPIARLEPTGTVQRLPGGAPRGAGSASLDLQRSLNDLGITAMPAAQGHDHTLVDALHWLVGAAGRAGTTT